MASRLARTPRIASFASQAALLSLLAGCGGAVQHPSARVAHEGNAPPASLAVSDDAFPEAVRALLASSPGSSERQARLAGVEARQMQRAVDRFKNKEPLRGLAAVVGGLELIHKGELNPSILGPSAAEALRGAARELSARGDEGRAQAVFEIWSRIASPADKAEIQTHLDALALWMKDAVGRGGPMQSGGALENAAVARRLLEPSDQALQEATDRASDWIDRAFALRAASDKSHKAPPSREDVGEALRALQTGAIVLAAIYLRDVDAKGALAAIDKAQAQDLAPDGLLEALKVAAARPSADSWLAVLRAMRPHRDAQGEENGDDEEIVRAATFATAIEAYRLDPTEIDSAAAVALALGEFGMAEASPLVLVDAVKAHPEPRNVSGALQITKRAMQDSVQAGEPDAARRTFHAAQPLLDLAADKALAGKIQPTGAQLRAAMGDIEVREGRLDAARALLEESVKEEKSGGVLLEIARIDRHDKRTQQAFDELREALAADDTANDVALRGEILLETSDLARQQGDARAARTPLTDALKELSKARNVSDPDDRARVERTLSRVLDRFGAAQPAQRALDRAFDAAPRNKAQAAATVGQIVARAFVSGDLAAARDGLQRGLTADLGSDDLVYYALWVRLLERQRHAPTDGTADRIFSRALDDAGWIGRLASFGAGQTKADALIASAKSPAEKTEALFYAAMDRRASGDAQGANTGLQQVLDAGGIDLMEVAIARDLLDGPRATVGGPVPAEAAQ
ncbi:MAG: tetratricopeptide repeat protein [Polyangiaceae bacterium]